MNLFKVVGVCTLLSLAVLAPVLASSANDFKHQNVVHLEDNFLEATSDGKLYFTKFYAPWCGHCKRLAPFWGTLAESYAGDSNVVIVSVDCTVAKRVCTTAGITGYPTLKLYQNGVAVDTYKGARSVTAMKEYLDEQRSKLIGETEA